MINAIKPGIPKNPTISTLIIDIGIALNPMPTTIKLYKYKPIAPNIPFRTSFAESERHLTTKNNANRAIQNKVISTIPNRLTSPIVYSDYL